MPDFKKGQLVAVRDSASQDWTLRVYDHISPEGLHFCTGLERATPPCWWNKICPAEHVWPDIFLGHDRDIIDSCRRSLNWEERKSKERWNIIERLHKRMSWLCEQLQAIGDRNGVQECPPSPHHDCRRGHERGSCAECWNMASLEAVKEVVDGA